MPDPRPLSDAPSAVEISIALDRILASAEFVRSRRLSDFLTYVVEGSLEDGAVAPKGYTIAIEALGRPAAFDPEHDAIVRVTASRLRVALARYYSAEGGGDPIVIKVPRGGYVPAISRVERRGLPAMFGRLQALSRLLAARVWRLLPPAPNRQMAPGYGRQDRQGEQIERAVAARAGRPRRG
jgi:hypothetical protein